MVLLTPKGPIGETERFVIIVAFVLMLIVVLPVIIMAFWFPRKYRASNKDAPYTPQWSHSLKIDLVVWLVPVAIVTALGILAWITTHEVDPYKPIEPGIKPLNIEAVSLDWKWLFIYPDQNIATINQIVFPAKVPLKFKVTSETVLASFFIPQLGSQIYAMPGKQARLFLMADEPGVYRGQNQQFSGSGFAGMHFEAIATPPEQFASWVRKIQKSADRLNLARFEEIRIPSADYPVTHFSHVEPGLFDNIINRHRSAGNLSYNSLSRKAISTDGKRNPVEEQ